MATVNQVVGGSFSDSAGNLLVNGYLIFQLTQDITVNTNVQICSGRTIRVDLNSTGSIPTLPVTSFWPGTYLVSAYSASGQLVWGPNMVSVTSSPSPYDIGVWVP